MIMMSESPTSSLQERSICEIRPWLESFSAAVRDGDFAAGQALFANDVCAFGTRADRIESLADLEANQWRPIWNSTRGYRFDFDTAIIEICGPMAWVAITWHSQGRNPAGNWFDRFGRATYILRKIEGRWLAVHSHHSLNPG